MQDRVFAAAEGDAYWQRNASPLERWDPATDLPLKLMDMYHLHPRTVIEIGAASGFRLAEIRHRYGSDVTGIDPSGEAVTYGISRYPGVRMLTGTAANVPWQEPSELVIVNFVLHWVDRTNLLKSIAEIDRLTVDGGFVIFGDFAPANQWRVEYHHRPGLCTYKQDYAAILKASGLYHRVGYLSGGHGGGLSAGVEEQERAGCSLLEKRLEDHYIDRAHGGVSAGKKG